MVERHISYCHAYGVLGVAVSDDLSGLVDSSQNGRERENSIEMRTSGGLCRSGREWADGNSIGGDFLKLAYSPNIEDEEAPSPRLSREDLGRILQQRGGKKAVVVANGRQQVAEALAAGRDAIEQGYGMGEDNLRQMAEQDVLWIPSVLGPRMAWTVRAQAAMCAAVSLNTMWLRESRTPARRPSGKRCSPNNSRNCVWLENWA